MHHDNKSRQQREHADEMYRPNAGAEGDGAGREPDAGRHALGGVHAVDQFQCRVAGDHRHHDRQQQQTRLIGFG